jgi:hypothetical protein
MNEFALAPAGGLPEGITKGQVLGEPRRLVHCQLSRGREGAKFLKLPVGAGLL